MNQARKRYPNGLIGYEIDKLSYLCRIVDKFDGLITKKPA